MAEIIASVGAVIGTALLGLAVRCLYQRIQEAGNCRCSCSSDEKDGCGCSCLTGKPKDPAAPAAGAAPVTAAPPAAQDMTPGSHLTPPVPRSRFTKRGRRRERQSQSTSSIDLDKIVQRQILHSMVRSSQAAQAAQAMLRIREEEEDDKEEKNPEAPCTLTPSGSSTGSGGSTTSVGPDTQVPRIPLRDVVRQIVEQQRRRHSKTLATTS